MLLMILERSSYNAVGVSSAEEALQLFEEDHKFDLILCDVMLKGEMNGLDLADAIKKKQPSIEILHMSGSDDAAIHKGRKKKAQIHLSKPFRKEDVGYVIYQALKGKKKSS